MPLPQNDISQLIETLTQSGLPEGLLAQVRQALPAHQDDADHWMDLATALRRLGNYAAADAVYQTALQRFSKNAVIWNNYGVLLRSWGKLDAAISAFDTAIGLAPAYASPVRNKAHILEKAHRFAEARKGYAKTLEIDPSDVHAANGMGVCFMAGGDVDAAMDWYAKALAIDPDFADALFNLAALRFQRKDRAGALPLAERLVRLHPEDAEARRMLKKIKDAEAEAPNVVTDAAQSLTPDSLRPELQEIFDAFRGNPASVFISYAWSDEATKAMAKRLAKDLADAGFTVFLDKNYELEVHEVLTLLAAVQNVVVLNDLNYAESCLLGQVPATQATSPYPSYAFDAGEPEAEERTAKVFAISAADWLIAKKFGQIDASAAELVAKDLVAQDIDADTPWLRRFIEGWRVDEVQMVFSNARNYRSISIAYLGGPHCLTGYPLFDFSRPEQYNAAFAGLVAHLKASAAQPMDAGPLTLDDALWTKHIWPGSALNEATFWRITDRHVTVWRPSLTPSGDAAAAINNFLEWERV